jgi:predicted ATPase/class 3 adenylate cyclase
LREIRKTVTIVFSDLKGSTAMGEKLDSEALREVMTRYFETMRAILEAHGGRVEKYIGDAIMAVFGLPRLHEDDAIRAVRAAADMRAALVRLNDELELAFGVRLANRTGVNTGEVVSGDPSQGQRLVVGDPVNLAARLEQAAPANEVLIGDTTYRLVRDAVDVERVEPLSLKGKSGAVTAYRLLRVALGEALARRHDTPLVGRARELELLEGALSEAAEARACILTLVIGDAGIGKTRLTGELARRLDGRARILRGRCLPYGQGITFWPLAEVVREAASIGDGDSLQLARNKLDALCDDREVVERVASAIGLSREQFSVEDLFWAVRKLFEALASEVPLLVVFDDLHWAEETFLDLVEHLEASAREAPILLVGCSRHDLLEQRPELASRPAGRLIELRPLSYEESRLVAEAALGGGNVAPDVILAVERAAEGNALFLEQLLSMLVDEGGLRLVDGVWVATTSLAMIQTPPNVQALMAARLDGLTEEERSVAEVASVIGQIFPVDAITALVPDAVRERASALLERLANKRLLAPVSEEQADRYRFAHVTIRDAAYQAMLKRSRASLHERFVEWADTRTDRDVEYEEIRGWHLEQAYLYLAALGPLDAHGIELGVRAANQLSSAGRRAFGRGDMRAAAGILRRAAALLPDLSPLRLELLPDLGEALLDLGEFRLAGEVLNEAVDAAALIGDAPLLAEARLVRLLVERHAAEPESWEAEVLREASRALPVFEAGGAHAELARTWRLLGYVHSTACRYGEAAVAAQRAIEQARLALDARQEARAATTYATAALYGPTPAEEAIRRCEEIVASELGDRQAEGLVLCALAQLHAMRGEIDRGRELYRSARAVLEDVGGVVAAASTSLDSASVEMLAGDPAAAEAELRRDYETLERMGEKYILPTIAALLGEAICAQGRYEEAATLSATAEAIGAPDDVDAQALWRCVRARTLAQNGSFAAAEELAREAVELLERTDALVLQADALTALSDVLNLSGQQDEAAETRARAAALYAAKGNLVRTSVAPVG